jgi:hypothetical protein
LELEAKLAIEGAHLVCNTTTFNWYPIQLRHYPYRFGLRILRILPKFQADGCKTFPEMPDRFSPLETYKSQPFDDMWHDAGAPEILKYIRGNKSLEIPGNWKPHLLPEDL